MLIAVVVVVVVVVILSSPFEISHHFLPLA